MRERSTAAPGAPAAADLARIEAGAWRKTSEGPVRVYLRGYLEGDVAARLARSLARPDAEAGARVAASLAEARGHFALVIARADWVVAAVDWVRSIPLFYTAIGGHWTLDDQAERLRRQAGLGAEALDRDAALALAMAGYTIDRATLYRGLEMLGPGECVLFRAGAAPQRLRYYTYRPWRVAAREPARLEAELAETTLDIVRRMLDSLAGRPLVIPLSAGYDSRLVASAARHLGAKNVRCFAYGRAGNFEAGASRAIAERLGYPWSFAPLTVPSQRRFFAGDAHRRYLDDADTCAAVPFVQDMSAILALKERGFIPADAVIANGNSGDYISGMHIAAPLRTPPARGMSAAARRERLLGALVDKHFALWDWLRTPANLDRIRALLWRSIESAGGALGGPECDHGLYEYAEFQDRQCKYVVTGQRIYEFLGHDWRLPLWDNAYLSFWESVPLAEKANQALYARMLERANWGGVWRDIPVNEKTIRPRWLAPLRFAAKLAHAPLGARRWHRFERRFLQYWLDLGCNSAVVPYRRVARDARGARHAVAWLAEDYLAAKGLALAALAGAGIAA
ncbi:MAG TPA: asparagine synthase-related protein [Alphaproteobacteria bacterium]